MKITAITITLNDDHVMEQWKKFHAEYATSLYKHIIVDNNSTPEYKKKIRNTFPKAIHIERKINGGSTGAYNDGIKLALNDPEVDSIMLLGNDCKISSDSIKVLHNLLFSDEKIGAVAPVLLEKDEKTIAAYGEKLNKDMGLNRLYHGEVLSNNLPDFVESECLPGGMNMMRREVYEKVGLQDESLFMYMDENDYFYRVAQKGYRMVATKKAQSAHCHIATEGSMNDNSLAWFYITRNHLLVCNQYKSTLITWQSFLRAFFIAGIKLSVSFILDRSPRKIYYYYLGLICGIIGYRKNFVKKSS